MSMLPKFDMHELIEESDKRYHKHILSLGLRPWMKSDYEADNELDRMLSVIMGYIISYINSEITHMAGS